MQHRQIAVGGVASEELVAARARQRHGEPGGANGARHVVGVQPVEGRLVQAVQRRLQVLDEVRLRQHHLVVLGPDGGGDPPRDRPLVELLLLEGQREGVDGALGRALGQVGH